MIDYIEVNKILKKSLNNKVEKEVLVHDKKKGTYYRKQLVNVEPSVNAEHSKPIKDFKVDDSNLSLDQRTLVTHLLSEYHPWIDHLSSDELSVLKKYTNVEYHSINKHLRGFPLKKPKIEELQQKISVLTSALNKSEVKTPLTVHRQIKGLDLLDKFEDCYIDGKFWEDPAFMSTTVVENSFKVSPDRGVIHLAIDVPKGKGIGGFVKEISSYSKEQEFLLNRGSRFKVTKITEKSPYEYVVNLKLVGRSSDSNE